MKDKAESISVLDQVIAQTAVVQKLEPGIDGQNSPDIGMGHESGESPQDKFRVVRLRLGPALRMRNGHDTIDVLIVRGDIPEALSQGPRIASRPGSGSENSDEVP